jgi:sigma-E factor negative regulatory protein RseC
MGDGAGIVRAIVRSVDGGDALVEVEQGGCGRCHEKGGCGGQQLTQMFCSGPRTYRVANRIGAAAGERVTIAIAAGSIRRTANLAYGLPLTATIVGALLGTWQAGDLGGMAGAAGGLAMALAGVRFLVGHGTGNPLSRPHIISRY